MKKNSIILPKVNREDTPNHKFHVENEWKICFEPLDFVVFPTCLNKAFKKKRPVFLYFFHSQNKLNANQMNHQAIAWLVKSPHVRPFFNQNLFIATSPSFMLKIMLNSLFVHDFMSKSHFSWLYQLYHHVSMAKPLFLSILYGYIIISLYNINI